jgi:hypothetical protein
MPDWLRALILIGGAVCLAISVGCWVLVKKGMLSSVARGLVKIRLIKKARYEKWQDKLQAVDDKLRLVSGASRRDRVIGIAAVLLSQITSMTLSLSILVALGESLSLGFIGAYVVGGFEITEPTVSRYLKQLERGQDPGNAQRWLAFLNNHREVIAAFDFFTVPTLTFRTLYCFFVIEHGRRRLFHFNCTAHPTSE